MPHTPDEPVIAWLLEGDPAIRWQVMRDLLDAPAEEITAERAQMAREGWVASVLADQQPDGWWGDEMETQHWMGTMRTLFLLSSLGLEADCPEAYHALERVRTRIRWHQLGNEPFFEGETEACINGRILEAGAYFGENVEKLAHRLLGEQLEDGGWNCEAPPSVRSSFNSTICVLEGLLAYERAQGANLAVVQARESGERYLLERGLFRRLTTGEPINQACLQFGHPPSWRFDILRGLDYFRALGHSPDPRMAEAVQILRDARDDTGRWPVRPPHPDELPPWAQGPLGSAERWVTLRAMRVLRWWDENNGAISRSG